MFNDQRAIISSTSIDDHHHHNQDHDDDDGDDDQDEQSIREIHALTPQRTRSSALSMASDQTASSSENFTTISREFNALVLAGTAAIGSSSSQNDVVSGNNNLDRIREEDHQTFEETNPLAIVADNNPLPSPRNDLVSGGGHQHHHFGGGSGSGGGSSGGEVSIQRVKKEEVETKINAWQTAKISKINNRFKREDAIINGWENEEIQKATSVMKKVERKLEEKKAKALEKMQNDIAKARRKAEEKRASAEAKRGTKVAKVMEIANLMKAIGKPPSKRSFF